MPNYVLTAPDGRQYDVVAPEGATEDEIIRRAASELGYALPAVQEVPEELPVEGLDPFAGIRRPEEIPVERGVFGALGAGFERGMARTGSLITDVLPALAGSMVGADEYARRQLEEAQAKEEALQARLPAQFPSYKDVAGIGDLPAFIAETIGEQIPNIVTSLIGGGIGGFAAKQAAKKAGKELAESQLEKRLAALGPGEVLAVRAEAAIPGTLARKQAVEKAVAAKVAEAVPKGQIIGAGAAGVGLNTGEIFQNIFQETGQLAPIEGILFGAAAGALDTILPAKLLKRFNGLDDNAKKLALTRIAEKKGVLRGLGEIGVGTLKSGALEGLTESAQEAISIAAEQFVDEAENYWGQKEFDRILEAGVRGAVAGGPFGTVETGARMLQERAVRKEEEARKAEEAAKEEEAARIEGERVQAEADAAATIAREADELENQIPAQVAALDERIQDLELTAAEDNKEAELELVNTRQDREKLVTRQSYLSEKAQARAIEDAVEREKALTAIEEKYAPKEAKEEAKKEEIPQEFNTLGDVATAAGLNHKLFFGRLKAERDKLPETERKVVESLGSKKELNRSRAEKMLAALQATPPTDKTAKPLTSTIAKLKEYIAGQDAAQAKIDEAAAPKLNTFVEQAIERDVDPANYRALTSLFKELYPEENLDSYSTEARTDAVRKIAEGVRAKEEIAVAEEAAAVAPVEVAEEAAAVAPVEVAEEAVAPAPAVAPVEVAEEAVAPVEVAEEAVAAPAPAVERASELDIAKAFGEAQEAKNLGVDYAELKAPYRKALRTAFEKTGDVTPVVSKIKEDLSNKDIPISNILLAKPKAPKASTGVAPTTPTTPEAVEREISRVFKDAKLGDRVVIANSPQAAGVEVAAPEGEVVRGAVIGDTAYLFSNNIQQGEEIAVLLHEVGSHLGMKRLVGAGNYNFLIGKVRGWASSTLDTVEARSAKAAEKRADGNPDELLAYFIEEAIRNGVDPIGVRDTKTAIGNFFRKIVAGVKNALAKFGIAGDSLNAQDIVSLAYGAAQQELSQKQLAEAAKLDDQINTSTSIPSNNSRLVELANAATASVINNAPPFAKKPLTDAIGFLESGVGSKARRAAISLTSLKQLQDIAGHYIPELGTAVGKIYNAVTMRDKLVADYRREFEGVANGIRDLIGKHKAQENTFNEVIGESTVTEFDPAEALANNVDPASLDTDQRNIYTKFKSLHPDMRNAYVKLRDAYATFSDEIISILEQEEILSPGSKLLTKLIAKRIKPYFPLYRSGDYWLDYTMPDGSRGVEAFKTEILRRQAKELLDKNGATDIKEYGRLREVIGADKSALTGDFRELMTAIQTKFPGVDNAALVDQMYSMYLDMFPTHSIMQQFRRREGFKGYEQDMLGVFNQIHPRMAMNMAQFRSIKEIDNAFKEAKDIVTAKPESPIVEDIASSLENRMSAFKNPSPAGSLGALAAQAGYASYVWYILGNISSAVVNLTQLPIVAYSLLGGKYGFIDTLSAMKYATKLYMNGGKDNNTFFKLPGTNISLTDYSAFGAEGRKSLPKEYVSLLERAIERGAIRRSLGQDIAEARTRAGSDPTSRMAQTMYAGSWLFQNVERFNREVTLIAAYKLAKDKGMNSNAAIEEALDMTELSHGAAMSELGPELFQNNFGRVIGVFKRFALSQIYLIGKLTRQIYKGAKGEDVEVAKTAAKQMAGIYAMAFTFAGAKGVPMFGALSTLLSLALGDEDDPYDLEEEIMKNFDIAVLRGPLGALLGIDLSGRTGFSDLIYRPDEKLLADVGPLLYAMYQIGGAPIGLAQNIASSVEEFSEGRFDRGVEKMTPAAIRNLLKALRYASEGARTKQGYLLKDTDAWDSFKQFLGFTPAEITETYARNNAAKRVVRTADRIMSRLYNEYYAARSNGDREGMADVMEAISEFRDSKVAKLAGVRMSSKDLETSYKNRVTRAKEVIDGIYLPKRAKATLIEEYGLGE